MQYHRIRLNESFSSSTVPFSTELRYSNGYYAYGNTLGGGIVTRFNVRSFLNDRRNQVIINDFIAYLSATTTTDELVKVLGDDEQLTMIFNQFYETTVMAGSQTPSSVVTRTMANVSGITYYQTHYNWDGTSTPNGLNNIPLGIDGASRSFNTASVSSRFSDDEGYYIPVFIKETYDEMSKHSYDSCPIKISLLLRPELGLPDSFTEATVSRTAGDEMLRVRNETVSRQASEPLAARFIVHGNELVSRCYNSSCVDNHYCDILYFTNQRLAQINVIDTEHIIGLIGSNPAQLTPRMVLDVLINEMVKNGEPVAYPIFSCIVE